VSGAKVLEKVTQGQDHLGSFIHAADFGLADAATGLLLSYATPI
jgi:hypothetical protein